MPGRFEAEAGRGGRDLVVFSYDAREFTAPLSAIADVRKGSKNVTLEQIYREKDDRYGPLQPYAEICCFVREGRRWVVLWHTTECFGLELELLDDVVGEIYPLPPEEAWRITLEKQDLYGRDVRVEGEAPSYPVPSPERWMRSVD